MFWLKIFVQVKTFRRWPPCPRTTSATLSEKQKVKNRRSVEKWLHAHMLPTGQRYPPSAVIGWSLIGYIPEQDNKLVTKWTPSCHQVVTKLSPCDHHVAKLRGDFYAREMLQLFRMLQRKERVL